MNATDDSLFNKLTADSGAGGVATLATGGIFKAGAHQGASYPFVDYQDVSNTPVYRFGGEAHRRLRYRLRVWSDSESWDVIGQIADRLEALLTDGTLTISGWNLKLMRLFNRFDTHEEDGGIVYPMVLLDYLIEIDR